MSGDSKPKDIIHLTPALHEYLINVSVREADVLRRLREETAQHPRAVMQISRDQGQFMGALIKMINAKKTIEVGVFTGYSSLVVALNLPSDGKIVACDVSEEFTNIAKRYWKEAGVENKIDLTLAPASETLQKLIDGNQNGTFDFVFIDADKTGYDTYYEQALKLVRPGGVIAIDNVLWGGSVINPEKKDEDTEAIRTLNQKIFKDERVYTSLVPIGDGLTLAIKL